MGVDVVDLLTYEAFQLGLNTLTFTVLTYAFRYLADIIHWFPKQDIHYFVLVLIFVYTISFDKRHYSQEPNFIDQGIRLTANVVLILGSTYIVGMFCDSKLPSTGDPEEATASMKCMGGMAGSLVVAIFYRLFTMSFLRSVMIGIQIVINIYYQFGALY